MNTPHVFQWLKYVPVKGKRDDDDESPLPCKRLFTEDNLTFDKEQIEEMKRLITGYYDIVDVDSNGKPIYDHTGTSVDTLKYIIEDFERLLRREQKLMDKKQDFYGHYLLGNSFLKDIREDLDELKTEFMLATAVNAVGNLNAGAGWFEEFIIHQTQSVTELGRDFLGGMSLKCIGTILNVAYP
jgi:hypothetical protein